METSKFEGFAIIELFGHSRIAGRVTEQSIGGTNMLRVDVPEYNEMPAFTRFIGGAAVYAINPCSEEAVMLSLSSIMPIPVYAWDVKEMANKIADQKIKAIGTHDKENGDDGNDLPY